MPVYTSDCCTIHHWPTARALRVQWHFMDDSVALRAAVEEGLRLVDKLQVKHWIADVSSVTTVVKDTDKTWMSEQGGRFVGAGLGSIITVLPSGALAKLSAKGWQREAAKANAGFAMLDAGSLDDAREAIAALDARKAA